MRKNKYLSPFTLLKSPFYFLEAVVGALPVAHEPSSFSFSLLLLSFTLVALSLVALDFALCLTKDRGGQCSLSLNIVSTQDGRVPIHHQMLLTLGEVGKKSLYMTFKFKIWYFYLCQESSSRAAPLPCQTFTGETFFSKSLGKTFKYTFLSRALFSGRMGGEAGGDVNERANEIAQLLK